MSLIKRAKNNVIFSLHIAKGNIHLKDYLGVHFKTMALYPDASYIPKYKPKYRHL